MKLNRSVICLVTLLSASPAFAYGITCPIDKTGMYFTEKVRTEMGKQLREHQFPFGYNTWVLP
jgi:hypothetical protein